MKSTLTLLFGLMLFSTLHAQVPSYVPTDGLVGWWPFNGNANDESGNGNDGVMVGGISNAVDRFGNSNSAFLFDGVSGYIDLPSLNNQPYTPITYSAWVIVNSYFPSSFGHKFRSIIGRNTAFITENGVIGFYADNNVNAGFYDNNFTMWRGGGQTGSVPFSASTPLLNEWTHVTYTQDTEGNWKWYINGSLTNSGNFTDLQNDYNYFQIGGCNNTTGNYFWNDKLDDIGLWNRALMPEEVQELYTGITPTPAPCVALPANLQEGIVGYWPFCGNANDESGNGNDGVVNGATLTEDRFGNANAAYSFDGVDDKIEIISDNVVSAISNAEVLSLSYWAKDNGGNSGRTAIGCYQLPTGGLYLVNDFSGNDEFGVAISPTGSVFNTAINNQSNLHHFVVVYDGTSVNEDERLQVYIDGANSTLNYPYTIPSQLGFGASSVFFGARQSTIPNEATDFWNGSLDDIAIWNRALTPEEVQELYTLDACTFTVYDTLTVENVINVYDTLTIENIVDIYDTTYINVEVYDTLTVENIINVYDTLTIENIVEVYDTLTVENVIDVFDTTTVVETVVVFDTLTVENVIDVFDTTTVVETVVVFDTLTVENVIDVYDTTYVTVTDTLIIDIPSGVGGTILNTLLLYPNPTSEQLTINYGNFAAMAGYSLSIFDNGGSAVHETNITQAQETLDISQWSAGVYQVVVYNAGGVPVETRQIVIQ